MPGLKTIFASLAAAALTGCGSIMAGPGFIIIPFHQYKDSPDGHCDPPNHDRPECNNRQRGTQPQQP